MGGSKDLMQEPALKKLSETLADIGPEARDRLLQAILSALISTDVKTLLASDGSLRKQVFTKKTVLLGDVHTTAQQIETPEPEIHHAATANPSSAPPVFSNVHLIQKEDGSPYKARDFLSPCGYATPYINNHQVDVLIDEGSESNLISREIALSCGLAIGPDYNIRINGITGGTQIDGTVVRVPIRFGAGITYTEFLVLPRVGPGVILGRPWARSARFSKMERDDCWHCTIADRSGAVVRFRARLCFPNNGPPPKDADLKEEGNVSAAHSW